MGGVEWRVCTGELNQEFASSLTRGGIAAAGDSYTGFDPMDAKKWYDIR